MSQKEAKPPVLLIDLSALYHAAFHVVHESEPVSKVHGIVIDSVRRCTSEVPGSLTAVCCDGKGNWRKALSPEYKAQRETKPAAFYEEFTRLKDRLRADGYLLWEFDGFEADDVIASACDCALLAGHDVTIATHDKDLCQCSAEQVTILNTQKWEKVDRNGVISKFGVAPHQLADLLALCGDKSDNVKGAEGIGQKTAAELLQRYGTLTDLYAAAHDTKTVATDAFWRTKDGKAPLAMHDKLLRAEADVTLGRKLVALKYDVPVKFEDIYERREVKAPAQGMIEAEFEDMISPGPGPQASPQNGKPAQPTEDSQAKAGTAGSTATAEVNGPGGVDSLRETSAVAPAVASETALVRMTEWERQLEPSNPSGLLAQANVLFQSRMYPKLGSAHAIAAVVARGRSLGLNAGTALDCIHWLEKEGKMALHAHLITALAEAHVDCEYFMFVEGDDTHATFETKNRKHPRPVRHTYFIEDAVDAGIATQTPAPRTAKPGEKDSRGNWDKRRKEMLRKTAAVQLARMVYPSAALGLYSLEEMGVDA